MPNAGNTLPDDCDFNMHHCDWLKTHIPGTKVKKVKQSHYRPEQPQRVAGG